MIHSVRKEELKIGISACLIGEKVRFDASNKPSTFCINELGQHVTYKSFALKLLLVCLFLDPPFVK